MVPRRHANVAVSEFRGCVGQIPSSEMSMLPKNASSIEHLNFGHINLGISHDTSQFACDSFRWFWKHIGKQSIPEATLILLARDGGGSNSSNKYIFK
jgi:Rhodopirellula transposase DDE domain